MSEYTINYTSGYMNGGGFIGCNYGKWHSQKELKQKLMEEFKRNEIGGVSIRFNRGGYYIHMTITIKATEKDLTGNIEDFWLDYMRKHGMNTSAFSKDDFTDNFHDKLNLIQKIVTSYNYNESNGMYDYYDTGFYDGYMVKLTD